MRPGPVLALAPLVLLAAAPARGQHDPRPLAIAPLEADLEAMRGTVVALERAIAAREPQDAEPLVAPGLSPASVEAIERAVAARVAALPEGASYEIRSDFGFGAVVPTGPDQVRLQVTGTVLDPAAGSAPGAVHLELRAVEDGGRRRWLLTSVAFSGIRTRPSAGSVAALVVGASVAGAALVGALLLALARRRRRACAAPGGGRTSPP